MDEPFGQRQKRTGIRLLTRRGHGRQRPAMEAVLGGNHGVRAVTILSAPLAGELDRGLIRLGATVAEEDLVERRVVDEQLGQLELWDRVEQVRDLNQLRRLFRQGALD